MYMHICIYRIMCNKLYLHMSVYVYIKHIHSCTHTHSLSLVYMCIHMQYEHIYTHHGSAPIVIAFFEEKRQNKRRESKHIRPHHLRKISKRKETSKYFRIYRCPHHFNTNFTQAKAVKKNIL